jgi:mannose-6-phosphate isomerase class I
MTSNYDKNPYVRTGFEQNVCSVGWTSVLEQIESFRQQSGRLVCVECYPGVLTHEVKEALASAFPASSIVFSEAALKLPGEIEQLVSRDLTDDRVFGRITGLQLADFFNDEAVQELRNKVHRQPFAIVFGTGASLVVPDADVLIYADLARWEIQRRQRRGDMGNLGAPNNDASPGEKYKRAFFIDWRVADYWKKQVLPTADYVLDTNHPGQPRMISGAVFRACLEQTVRQPFRVVPFFDPGPWGGQWMRKVCDLPPDAPNYAWCFDCVPEENSLVLGFGELRFEVPAIDLVFSHPEQLLGEAVHARFGTEFPIRFDFLDTMGGGNLSLQVHPLTEYIQQHFGMAYTQDESYYLLDAGEDACVYLGLREDVDRGAMCTDLEAAQSGGPPFSTDKYVNRWPARKHDHFLIPAGTVHCSGRNSMVLEISATPYIFTFKLWDWGRLGLDGKPRPIHLRHGINNIQWKRKTGWVESELINRFEPLQQGEGWREERTGLHKREFIETRRHWFTREVPHHTNDGVNVLNLVEGEAAIVESPTGAFEPLVIHYAETFIVPACVGPYTIRPLGNIARAAATLKAFVRTEAGC